MINLIGFLRLMGLGFLRMAQIWLPSIGLVILLLMILTRLKNDSSWIKRTLDNIIN